MRNSWRTSLRLSRNIICRVFIVRSQIRFILIILAALLLLPNFAAAQFVNSNAAGTMKSTLYQEDTTYYETDTTIRTFSIKRFVRSLAHKDSMTVSNSFFGSMVIPGAGQIYNRDYWKVPVIYGALGGCIGGAVAYNVKWKKNGLSKDKDMRNALIWGAVATYWGQLLDGTACYKSTERPLPGRASIYSALLPGLGQAYNGDYWHIPIYYGGFMISGYCWAFNQKQYKRYRKYYKEWGEGTYEGHLTEENLIWYRDYYRRNRDYSVVATLLIYILNVVDANVFAHFANFDISDDITFNVQPAIIEPIIQDGKFYTSNPMYRANKFGMQMNITF